MLKKSRVEDDPGHGTYRTKRTRRLVEVPLRSKEPLPQTSGKMSHFKLTGSPKRKFYKPKRKLQYEAVTDPTPGPTHYFDSFITDLGRVYPLLTIIVTFLSGKKWGILQCKVEVEPNLLTPIYNPRMVITTENETSLTFKFEVLYKTLVFGHLPADLDRFHDLVKSLLPDSGYFACEGIPPDVSATMSFNTKSARIWGCPFGRVDHIDCPMWLMAIPATGSSSLGIQRCEKCTNLMYYIVREAKKRREVTPEQKTARVQVSSHYPMKYLSPASLQLRREHISRERKFLKRKVSRVASYDVDVDNITHDELLKVTGEITRKSKGELDKILGEAVKAGKGEILMETWKQDVEDRVHFRRDQRKNLTGCKGNRWSLITIRMALAVYTRSPAAYEALSSFHLLQLPSAGIRKTYTRSNVEAAGEVEQLLFDECLKYDSCVSSNQTHPPLCKGALIFGEVKVAAKLHWNSPDDKFVGHTMTSEEMSTLSDLYEVLLTDKESEKADYVMQTLWRDLTSECDIVGPYYTSNGPFKAKTMLACVMDALRKFQAHGFDVCVFVCDGASSNLTMVKTLLGKQGPLHHNDSLSDRHEIDPSFINPFSGEKIYVVICPSHQLKNMIAALYESRAGGVNNFEKDGISFGWTAIEDMLSREVQRKKQNQLPRVPGLKENFVDRDPWTRLNVKPAKIMQQEHVISELWEYSNQLPPPPDSVAVQQTICFLQACNKLFERGIIGKKVFIKDMSSPILTGMMEGYQFFSAWFDELLSQGYKVTTTSGKKFLSWQTWDLLRLMYYGLTKFCADFTTAHPGYTVYPIQLNGSAIETFFSQEAYYFWPTVIR